MVREKLFSGRRIHYNPISGVQREIGAVTNEEIAIVRPHFRAIMELGRRQTLISLVPDAFIFNYLYFFSLELEHTCFIRGKLIRLHEIRQS